MSSFVTERHKTSTCGIYYVIGFGLICFETLILVYIALVTIYFTFDVNTSNLFYQFSEFFGKQFLLPSLILNFKIS